MAKQVVSNYKNLIVWQKSMELAENIYTITTKLPQSEVYSLCSQLRRAAISIPSNIAEGQARNSQGDFIRFLNIAQGSNCELETQLLLCIRLGYFTDEDVSSSLQLSNEVGKMVTALIKKLATSN